MTPTTTLTASRDDRSYLETVTGSESDALESALYDAREVAAVDVLDGYDRPQ